MAGWLAKATKTFGKSAPLEPEPFELTCGCHNDVRGMRTREHQVMRCARCGTSLFVLPRNPYPQPKELAPKKKKSAPKAKSKKPIAAPLKSAPIEVSDKDLLPAKPIEPSVEIPVRPRVDLRATVRAAIQRRKAFFTPFRMLMLALIAVMGATGYWYWHGKQVDQAEIDVAAFAKSGEEAFHANDFATAEIELGKACKALDILGRDDPRSHEVRQLHREATAISHLLSLPLASAVESAKESLSQDETEWDKRFRTMYGEGWIVAHCLMEPFTSDSGEQLLQFSYPLRVDGLPISIVTDKSPFTGLFDTDQPREVIFATRLASCRMGGLGNDRWVVTADSKSLFLWSDYESLVELGLADDDAAATDPMRKLVSEQAQLLEASR